jgi:transposase
MEGILSGRCGRDKQRLLKRMRNCGNADMRMRYLIVITLAEGTSALQTAQRLKVSRSTVYRVASRFREFGEAGLVDRREENGSRKLDEDVLAALYDIVASSPQDHGWQRPTWTREMLRITLQQITGVTIHVSTMSRALKAIGARRGRPRPTVGCPWSEQAKTKRLREIGRLVNNHPQNEVVVYEDEVDLHLNPKIGSDWMTPGQQKQVLTPGRNEKRYLAGALDAQTARLQWVEGVRKTSSLFVALLQRLLSSYPQAKRIHVIVDNYVIHSTKQVQLTLGSEQGRRLQLHFLPPYCPDHNRIERTWQDLHANVTRNHTCPDMDSLLANVRSYLNHRNRTKRHAVA